MMSKYAAKIHLVYLISNLTVLHQSESVGYFFPPDIVLFGPEVYGMCNG